MKNDVTRSCVKIEPGNEQLYMVFVVWNGLGFILHGELKSASNLHSTRYGLLWKPLATFMDKGRILLGILNEIVIHAQKQIHIHQFFILKS